MKRSQKRTSANLKNDQEYGGLGSAIVYEFGVGNEDLVQVAKLEASLRSLADTKEAQLAIRVRRDGAMDGEKDISAQFYPGGIDMWGTINLNGHHEDGSTTGQKIIHTDLSGRGNFLLESKYNNIETQHEYRTAGPSVRLFLTL